MFFPANFKTTDSFLKIYVQIEAIALKKKKRKVPTVFVVSLCCLWCISLENLFLSFQAAHHNQVTVEPQRGATTVFNESIQAVLMTQKPCAAD